jgi:hypothetical protein
VLFPYIQPIVVVPCLAVFPHSIFCVLKNFISSSVPYCCSQNISQNFIAISSSLLLFLFVTVPVSVLTCFLPPDSHGRSVALDVCVDDLCVTVFLVALPDLVSTAIVILLY